MLGAADRIAATTGAVDKRGRVRGLTAEQYVALYQSGVGCTVIGRRAGVSAAMVRRDLLALGVALRPRARRLALSEAEYRRLYEAEGLGVRAIAKRCGLTEMKVWRDLKELGIAMRSNTVQTGLSRDWLDVIDSDAKAYAFGLFCADGCLTRHRARIQLQEGDRHVLERIRDAAGGGHVVMVRKGGLVDAGNGRKSQCKATVGLRWDCKRIADALRARGICENKSQVLPEIMAPEPPLLSAFVRGLVDGDGCLHISTSGYPTVQFTNLNESLLSVVAAHWKRITGKAHGISRRVRPDGRIDKYVAAHGRAAVAVAEALYLTDESSIALSRKRALAHRMVTAQQARFAA